MKPRNHVVVAMLKAPKKAGVHQKTTKAVRKKEKMESKKEIVKSLSENTNRCKQ